MHVMKLATWLLLSVVLLGCHQPEIRTTTEASLMRKEPPDPAENKPQALAELERLRRAVEATVFPETGWIRHGESGAQTAYLAAKDSGSLEPFDAGGAPSLPDALANLTDLGVEQAKRLGAVLAERPPEVIIVSDMARAQLTLFWALTACGERCRGVIVEVDSRARERSRGKNAGHTSKGWARDYPAEKTKEKERGRIWYRYPKGESMIDLLLRVGELNFPPINGQ